MKLWSTCIASALLLAASTTAHAARIAFCSDYRHMGAFDIYTLSEDNLQPQLLIDTGNNDVMPEVSPNGKKIAFSSFTGEQHGYDIFVADIDGSNITRVTNSEGNDTHPSWSPDSSRIAFSGRGTDGSPDIFVMSANGTGRTQIAHVSFDYEPEWSPTSSKIAFTELHISDQPGAYKSTIHTVNADGTNLRALTNGQQYDGDPTWSPDGSKLAFTSNRASTNQVSPSQVFTMTPEGTGITQLTYGIKDAGYARFIDADRIVYLYSDNFGAYGLYVFRIDTGEQTRLTTEFGSVIYPTLVPPQTQTAPVANDDVYVLSTKGKKPSRVLTASAPGVLTNDTDPDGDVLTAELVSAPTKGTLLFNSDGSFTFKPKNSKRASHTFTYRITQMVNGDLVQSLATVTILVNPKKP